MKKLTPGKYDYGKLVGDLQKEVVVKSAFKEIAGLAVTFGVEDVAEVSERVDTTDERQPYQPNLLGIPSPVQEVTFERPEWTLGDEREAILNLEVILNQIEDAPANKTNDGKIRRCVTRAEASVLRINLIQEPNMAFSARVDLRRETVERELKRIRDAK